ncbi:class C sortase [Bifidobacterium longum subsp. infantis]|uniref:Sortase n=2 Tax=Bifidobacterium longum TaxID=216816 RepID=A0A0M4LUD5_BIFLI|nr:class C sortase [Bifidobacterium longum]ALE08827.1 Sortase [Bifidobacterium longum subsp. infantis]OQM70776.1 Sortase [Bifidobacterium longum subsp. infantis]
MGLSGSADQEWWAVLGIDVIRASWKARRRLLMRRKLLSVTSIVLVVLGLGVIAMPSVLQARAAAAQSSVVMRSEREVSGWSNRRAEGKLKEARAYNRALAARGQYIFGETRDPFTDSTGSVSDKAYESALDTGDGVMGSIVIPKIGVNLPIYHGASESVLELGAGHLYGSSLPVGGADTHTVITGHRGLVKALMFTRLDELKPGDVFRITVMGKTLGYRIDRISVIEPSDVSKLRIVTGEDRVTLMTCTPYGVNTHRLLVSALRADIPAQASTSTGKGLCSLPAPVLMMYALALLGAPLMLQRSIEVARHSSGVMIVHAHGRVSK